MKKLFAVLFTFGVLCTFFIVNSSAASVSGTMSDTSSPDNGVVNWVLEYDTLTEEAKLILSGDGYMPNYTEGDDNTESEYWYSTLYDSGCWITELVIEEGVRSISESAFMGEERLESVVLPDSIEFIGDSAFSGTAITSVNIPSKVEAVNGTMFSSDYIKNYHVDESNPYLKSVDGVVYSKDMSDLKAFPVGRFTDNRNYSFRIPETVKAIATYAFMNGDAEEITIPGTVKDIENQAFLGNIYLERLNIEEGVEHIFDSAFLSCTALKNVLIPSSVTYLGYWSLGYVSAIDCEGLSYFLDQAEIPHPEITEKNASFYVDFTQYTLEDFTYWKPAEDFSVTGSCGSAAEPYALVNGFTFTRNHIPSEWITDENPTCTETGSKYANCTVCGEVAERAEIPATGHNYILGTLLEPSCKENGFEMWFCDVCYDSYLVNFPAIAHTKSDYIIDKTPTCTENGFKHKECTVCKEVFETVELPATGHTASGYIIDEEPTCDEKGSQYKCCTVCNAVLQTVAIPAKGHTDSDYIIDREPTCTQNGSKHKECTICKTVLKTVDIPTNGHSGVMVPGTPATCTQSGNTDYGICDVCNVVLLKPTTTPATGHTSSSWITDKAATVNSTGSKHKECTVCKEVLETAEIPQQKPGAVKLGSASNTSTGVKISWSKVTGADSYTVYRKSGTGNYKALKTVTGTTYTDTSAKSGTKYTYTVKAKNEAGYGSYNTTGLTKLYLATPKVTVSNGSSGVTVKWNKITGAKGYYVYRKTSSASSYTKIATVKSGSTVSYTDKTAKSGTKYYYTVKAYNGSYVSTTKASSLKMYLATPKVTVANASTGVTVKWNKITGAKGYYVYRKVSGSSSYTKIATIKSGSTVSYTDKKATAGKKYYYTVKAYNGSYYSTTKASSIIEFLKAPTIKTVTSGKSGVTVKWAKATGADGYYVYRKTGTGSYSKIATVKGNTKVSYLDKTAKKGTTYTYYVKAYSGSSVSVSSKTLKIKDKY